MNKKNIISKVVLCFAALFMLVGWGNASDGNVLRWNILGEPETLDPLAMTQRSMQVLNNTFEGLYRTLDEEPQPAIAESHELSDDELTYTFHLKETNWSDGQPLTAHDFRFAWLRHLDPELKSQYASNFFVIENAEEYFNGNIEQDSVGIKVIDDHTLEVKLNSPAPYFISLVSSNFYFPVREDVSDPEGNWSMDPETAISNGPFKLIDYQLNDGLTIAKNEEYWNIEKVNLDTIEVSFIEDPDSALIAFENNEIDLFKGVPGHAVSSLVSSSDEFYPLPIRGVQWYSFNTEKEPFDNPDVRRAFNMAIDRQEIVNNITKGGQKPAQGTVPHMIHLSNGDEFRSTVESYDSIPTSADVEGAQEALRKAGYPDGDEFPEVTLTVDNNAEHPEVAQAMQQMWKDNLNVDIKIEVEESNIVTELKGTGDFQMIRAGWTADYDDAYNLLTLLHIDSKYNYGNYNNPEVNELLRDSTTAKAEERDEILKEIERIGLDEDAAVLPMYEISDPCMVRDGLVGWDKTSFAHWFFGYADIEK